MTQNKQMVINTSHLNDKYFSFNLASFIPQPRVKKKYTINEEKAHENKEKKAFLQKY